MADTRVHAPQPLRQTVWYLAAASTAEAVF